MGAQPGKYQIAHLFACQTLGYLDPAMFERRAALNPGDTEGTKFLDIIATTLPSYPDDGMEFSSLFEAVTNLDKPKTFNDILAPSPAEHISVVYGEHDNTYRP
ncbi:MAG TPA: hypothetical protein VM925_13610 [Labilithrix sp.]|jgi:hypothetical protein|nr:hypothetical protein [Labilithrix sp.]